MKEIFVKLLTVKSIVTLVLTGVFAYLSATGAIGPDLFMSAFTVVIAFYFGTQYERKTSEIAKEVQEVGK
mgnify:CR=1 FL=1